MRRDVRRRDLSIAIGLLRVQTPRMSHDTFVSITDAAELAGVSKKTVERAYKRFMDHPEFGEMIEKREHGSGYRYFVTKSFVDKCVGKNATKKGSRFRELVEASDKRSVAALIEQLEIKDRRIDKLTEMLQQKEEFNQALISKGLNLSEGKGRIDQDDIDENLSEGPATQTESSSIIDAHIVARGKGTHEDTNKPPLFPTIANGVAKVGKLLRHDIRKKHT